MPETTSDFRYPEQSYDDLLLVPRHRVAELIAGRVYAAPRPAIRHAMIAMAIGEAIGRRGTGPQREGDWFILPEPELHLGHPQPRSLVLVPDLAGWRADRAEGLLDLAAATTPPDWICEILSPSSVGHDRVRKMRCYADAGVDWAWLVDPTDRTFEVFRREGTSWLRVQAAADHDPIEAQPFGLPLPLHTWWTVPAPVVQEGG